MILALVDLAGLRDVVRVIIGPSDASLKRLHESGTLRHINLLFLDHYKPAYTSDLKLCEALGLIGPGAVLAADNVIKPGNPQYLEYVRASPKQKKERLAATRQSGRERSGDEQIPEKYLAQYEKRVSNEAVDWSVEGNPKLVYESRLVESYEPTGVPVSLNPVVIHHSIVLTVTRTALRLHGALASRTSFLVLAASIVLVSPSIVGGRAVLAVPWTALTTFGIHYLLGLGEKRSESPKPYTAS